MAKNFKKTERPFASFAKRNSNRKVTLIKGTLNLVGYFIQGQGLSEADARLQMNQLSYECRDLLYLYELGNTQPLINAIANSNLPFMDESAKAYAATQLITE